MSDADFLTAPYDPAVDLPDLDLTGPARFYNRELSWLGFNWRVVQEAENPRVPLLERLRFLSISAGNLDEFYTVRVAGLRELAQAGNVTPAADGLTPAEQLLLINQDARALMLRQQAILVELLREMDSQNIMLEGPGDLSDDDLAALDETFLNQVFAVLSPLAIDPAHPFPFLPNTGFALAVQLERVQDKKPLQALLPIPAQIDRFVRLPAPEGCTRYLPLEELLVLKIPDLFPGYRLKAHFEFRVLRDSTKFTTYSAPR
jgi:polyphosphate kinase